MRHVFGGSCDPRQRQHHAGDHHQLHRWLHPHADAEPGERFPRGPEFPRHRDPELRSPCNGQTSAGTGSGNPGLQRRLAVQQPRHSGLQHHRLQRIGATSGTNWYQNDSTFQFSEQLSWTHGSHNIMAGLEFRRLATGRAAVNSAARRVYLQRDVDRLCAGRFHSRDCRKLSPRRGRKSADAWREWRDGFFVLDKWQVSRKLTLNYGIRYELPTVAVHHQRQSPPN